MTGVIEASEHVSPLRPGTIALTNYSSQEGQGRQGLVEGLFGSSLRSEPTFVC